MTLQFATSTCNSQVDLVASTTGASAVLQFWSGPAPQDCAADSTGMLLGQVSLPSTWMSGAVGGVATSTGAWAVTSAAASGEIGYFRLLDSGSVACWVQGTVGLPNTGADMAVVSTTAVSGQPILPLGLSIISPNA